MKQDIEEGEFQLDAEKGKMKAYLHRGIARSSYHSLECARPNPFPVNTFTDIYNPHREIYF